MRVVALIALMCAVLIPSTAAQLPGFGVGLLRPDGILVPVAVLDGGKWIDPWPPVTDDMQLNGMIESVPSYWRQRKQGVPGVWHVVTAESPLQVDVLTHIVFGEHCGNQVGLLTDAPRSSWDSHRRRLALTRVMPVVSPVTIEPGDSEWRELVAHARLEVTRQEPAAITRNGSSLRSARSHPRLQRAAGFSCATGPHRPLSRAELKSLIPTSRELSV